MTKTKKPAPPKRGPKPLPEGMAASCWIRERVTPAQLAAYKARGGKKWLVGHLGWLADQGLKAKP